MSPAMPPKISVVIPTYRRPDLLKKCLSALVAQSFPKSDYEVIVVSDGPDVETETAVREIISGNFRYLALPQKGGPAAARNLGWQAAQALLIAFTDDDTVPDADWLSDYAKHYNGEVNIAYTGKIVVPRPERPTDHARNTAGLETADFVTANCCITRAALEKVGGFDKRFAAAWREDSDLEFRLLEAGVPIVRLTDALVVHPVREAPWGVSIKEQKKGVFNALLYKKFPEKYRQKIQPRSGFGLLRLNPRNGWGSSRTDFRKKKPCDWCWCGSGCFNGALYCPAFARRRPLAAPRDRDDSYFAGDSLRLGILAVARRMAV